jgi:16S rRNA (guanine1207-N2)-methyltransferase
MGNLRSTSNPHTDIHPYPQEGLLIDAIPRMNAGRLLCMSAGLAQFAGAAARASPSATVTCTYLDLYRAKLATEYWRDAPPNLGIECTPDLPGGEADVVALPFSARGEAELTRDLLQTGHQRLRIGGTMFATTDNPADIWLRDELSRLFGKVRCEKHPTGTLYTATKTGPLKKEKNFGCEFAFRDRGRLIRAYTRPGVFSHRHVDVGARRLIDAMELRPGARILDIGCGAGVVALAAACREPSATVHAVDSSARAIECTQRGAALNGLKPSPCGRGQGEGALDICCLTTELNAAGNYANAGTYDLALANPPYYASFRIAEHFLTAARDALRPGGRILVVTKSPRWYEENMPAWYEDITIEEVKGYFLIEGTRPDGQP